MKVPLPYPKLKPMALAIHRSFPLQPTPVASDARSMLQRMVWTTREAERQHLILVNENTIALGVD